jgi:hypothetical protein
MGLLAGACLGAGQGGGRCVALSAHALCVDDGAGRQRPPVQGRAHGDVNKSFSDILEDLDAAAFVNGTARKGNMCCKGDFSYAATSDKAALPWA